MNPKIFEISISKYTKKDTLKFIKSKLFEVGQHMICTVNPEILVFAFFNKFYKDILKKTSLNTCDGTGVQFATAFKTHKYAGVDMLIDICDIAQEHNKKVFLLGSANDQVLKKTKHTLLKKFPNLMIVGTNVGPKITRYKDRLLIQKNENEEVIDQIIDASPDILFVAFGHPKQEMWIAKHLKEIPSVKIAIGVGGSFDYISKTKKRPPLFIQKLGLEWLMRLLAEPKRVFRIGTAVIVFPIIVTYSKILSYVKFKP